MWESAEGRRVWWRTIQWYALRWQFTQTLDYVETKLNLDCGRRIMLDKAQFRYVCSFDCGRKMMSRRNHPQTRKKRKRVTETPGIGHELTFGLWWITTMRREKEERTHVKRYKKDPAKQPNTMVNSHRLTREREETRSFCGGVPRTPAMCESGKTLRTAKKIINAILTSKSYLYAFTMNVHTYHRFRVRTVWKSDLSHQLGKQFHF